MCTFCQYSRLESPSPSRAANSAVTSLNGVTATSVTLTSPKALFRVSTMNPVVADLASRDIVPLEVPRHVGRGVFFPFQQQPQKFVVVPREPRVGECTNVMVLSLDLVSIPALLPKAFGFRSILANHLPSPLI